MTSTAEQVKHNAIAYLNSPKLELDTPLDQKMIRKANCYQLKRVDIMTNVISTVSHLLLYYIICCYFTLGNIFCIVPIMNCMLMEL